jgi:hypothetical protein
MSVLLNELLNEDSKIALDEADDASEKDGEGEEGGEESSTNEDLSLRRMSAALNALSEGFDPENLHEAVNIIRQNAQTKTVNLAHRAALLLAKSKKDVLYTQYAKYNGMRISIRDKIYQKYGQKAMVRARALMSGSSVQGTVKK